MAVELVIVSTAVQSANYTAYKPSTGRPPLQFPRVRPLAPFSPRPTVAEREMFSGSRPLHTPQGRARPQVTPGPRGGPPSPLSPPPQTLPLRPRPLGIRTDSCFPPAGSDPPPSTSPRLPAPTLQQDLSTPRARQLLLAEWPWLFDQPPLEPRGRGGGASGGGEAEATRRGTGRAPEELPGKGPGRWRHRFLRSLSSWCSRKGKDLHSSLLPTLLPKKLPSPLSVHAHLQKLLLRHLSWRLALSRRSRIALTNT